MFVCDTIWTALLQKLVQERWNWALVNKLPQNLNLNCSRQQQVAGCWMLPHLLYYPISQCQRLQTAAKTGSNVCVSATNQIAYRRQNNVNIVECRKFKTLIGRGASLFEPMVFNMPGSRLERTTCKPKQSFSRRTSREKGWRETQIAHIWTHSASFKLSSRK